MTRVLAVLLALAAPASATPWDIPDGNGGWKPNPDCTGSCRETGIPDSETKPSPSPSPRDPADQDRLHGATDGSICYGWWNGKPQIWVLGTPPKGAVPVALCHELHHPVGTAFPRDWHGELRQACAAGQAPREWCSKLK
ncbi:hypothetical protein [Neotabrizicola sp. sgz301269]|uniref:hypothetical protein n=1 Tax=Neotabrizicola sp. sgz301269 TaxID=3276282 RepID=UPI0037703DC5